MMLPARAVRSLKSSGGKCRGDVLILHALVHLHTPRKDKAIAAAAKGAAAVAITFVQAARCAMLAQIGGAGADDQLQRKQASGNQAVLWRGTRAKAGIDTVLGPVADALVQRHLGLHLGVEAAVHVQHRAECRWQDRARPDDAQQTGCSRASGARLAGPAADRSETAARQPGSAGLSRSAPCCAWCGETGALPGEPPAGPELCWPSAAKAAVPLPPC